MVNEKLSSEELRVCIDEGLTYDAIAAKYGMHVVAVRKKANKEGLFARKKERESINHVDIDKVKSLLFEGRTLKSIAIELNVSYKWLHGVCCKKGIVVKSKVDGQKIQELYEGGASSVEIGKLVGEYPSRVLSHLKKNGVLVRKSGPVKMVRPVDGEWMKGEYVKGRSANDIAKEIGVAHHMVEKWLKEEGVELRGMSAYGNVDESFFEVIDTEEKAYWLGFFSADGNIMENSGQVQLELQWMDESHLWKWVNSVGAITKPVTKRGCMFVQFKSKKMVEDLMKKGLSQKKTYCLAPYSVRDDLKRHYWRGFVDGDGTILNKEGVEGIAVCGTEEMCEGFRQYVLKLGVVTDAQVREESEHLWRFGVSSQETEKVVRNLYKDSILHLDRKMERAKMWFEEEENGVRRISLARARAFAANYHYLRTVPPATINYGLFDNGLVGFASIGSSSGRNVAASIFGEERAANVRELVRFALSVNEKNKASEFLSKVLRLAKSENTAWEAIVTFADPLQGHTGVVYRACGAISVGRTAEELGLKLPDGEIVSGKNMLAHIADKGYAVEECAPVLSEGKYKYVFLLGSGDEKRVLSALMLGKSG